MTIQSPREQLSEYVLRRNNGETFTKEQIEDFLEPISDKALEDKNNGAKKYVKVIQDDNFDDLPF